MIGTLFNKIRFFSIHSMFGATHTPTKKSMLAHTLHVGRLTAISRFLGMIREMLMANYLGANALSDVFIAAFSIPNALRKIFAEGALSAAIVPEIVRIVRQEGQKSVSNIMTSCLIIFQGMVLVLCALIMWHAEFIMKIRVPGFSPEQLSYGAQLLRILAPFIFFLSSSSLLASALHSIARFGVPAFGPILLNIAFIVSILLCIWFNFSIKFLCFGILFGGFLLLMLHLAAYMQAQFFFGRMVLTDISRIRSVLGHFFFSAIAMSTVELKLIIDSQFASYLPEGSLSLIYYAERFMGIPLGIFATSFAVVLLPYLSRVCKEAPEQLHFYLLESFKLVFWVVIPVMMIMGFLAPDIFITLFSSKKFDLFHAQQAGVVLQVYLLGLFFYSINKTLHNFFFSFQATWIPATVSIVSAFFNVGLNVIMMRFFLAPGLILASNIAVGGEMIAMVIILAYWFEVPLDVSRFCNFMVRSTLHALGHIIIFLSLFYGIKQCMIFLFPGHQQLLFTTILFWAWVCPILGLIALSLLYTRRFAGIDLYFLDE